MQKLEKSAYPAAKQVADTASYEAAHSASGLFDRCLKSSPPSGNIRPIWAVIYALMGEQYLLLGVGPICHSASIFVPALDFDIVYGDGGKGVDVCRG